MGLFGKLKGLKNAITGGGATVTVEVGEAHIGQPVPILVKATATADVSANAVYALISATEEATVPDVDVARDGGVYREDVSTEHQTIDFRVDLTGPQQLQEGQEYAWEGSFTIPPDARPSFYGQLIKHGWYIQAGLDARGNDPDSGWIEFHVAY